MSGKEKAHQTSEDVDGLGGSAQKVTTEAMDARARPDEDA